MINKIRFALFGIVNLVIDISGIIAVYFIWLQYGVIWAVIAFWLGMPVVCGVSILISMSLLSKEQRNNFFD